MKNRYHPDSASVGVSVINDLKKGGDVLAEGTVKWFSDKKGYGFIEQEDGNGDIFVHYSSIDMPGFRTLAEGDRVNFEIESNERGSAAKKVLKV
jgi:CspA family cold shock protein